MTMHKDARGRFAGKSEVQKAKEARADAYARAIVETGNDAYARAAAEAAAPKPPEPGPGRNT